MCPRLSQNVQLQLGLSLEVSESNRSAPPPPPKTRKVAHHNLDKTRRCSTTVLMFPKHRPRRNELPQGPITRARSSR